VGIGTTTTTININSGATVLSKVAIRNDSASTTRDSEPPTLNLINDSSVTQNQMSRLAFSARSGIGAPIISADITAIYVGDSSGNGRSSDLVFGTSLQTVSQSPIERMRIASNGNVGIGTNLPTADLHLGSSTAKLRVGPTYTSGGDRDFIDILADATDTRITSINERFHIENKGGSLILNETSGNVGIGTTNPVGKLVVFGTGSSGGPSLSVNPNSSSIAAIEVIVGANSTGQDALYVYSTSTAQFNAFIRSNGNLENRNNSYGGISDIKLKENITNAKPKLNDLNKVRVVNFNFKNEETKQLGVIAQELQEIFPGMVEETEDKDREGKLLGTTTKSVKYSVFVPMLIKAVQELKEQLDELKAKVG
jgi:hypothetical protein